MKVFSLLFLLFPIWAGAQTTNPSFNWKSQIISPDNNLRGMTKAGEDTATIVGLGGTFMQSADKGSSWHNLKIIDGSVDFKDMSFSGDVGYVVSERTIIIDNPTGGEADVKANGIILKSANKGLSWNVLSLNSFGEGGNTSLNPSAPGCYDLDFTAVHCIDDQIVYAALRWNDRSSGTVVSHSALLKSTDGGTAWKAVTLDFGGDVINRIKHLNGFVYFGGNELLRKISVADDVLTDIYPSVVAVHTDSSMFIFDLFVYNNQEIYATSTNDGVFFTTDEGATFTKLTSITGGNAFFKINNEVMICLGSSSKSKSTIDGGNVWTSNYPGSTIWAVGGVLNDSLICLAKQNIYRIAINDLKSGVNTWKSQKLSETESFYTMEVFDENNAILTGGGENLLTTSNKGLSWTNTSLPALLNPNGLYDFNSISRGNGAEYAVSRRLKIAEYADASKQEDFLSGVIVTTGNNWESWTILNNMNVGKDNPTDPSECPTAPGCFGMDPFVIECVDSQTAYMYVDWYDTISTESKVTHSRVFKTSDGGGLWTSVTEDLGNSFVTGIAFEGDTGYIAGNNILLKTIDGGENFTNLFPIVSQGTDGSMYFQSLKMISSSEIYLASTNDGVFYSADGGATFAIINGVSGATDIAVLDNNSFMTASTSAKTQFTNDGGANWLNCSPGATIYSAGEILNDSLYVLGKSSVFKIAVSDLKINTSSRNLTTSNKLKALYGTSELRLVSSDKNIDRCYLYSIDGKLISITEPRTNDCRFTYSAYKPGIYIISAEIAGQRSTLKVIFK